MKSVGVCDRQSIAEIMLAGGGLVARLMAILASTLVSYLHQRLDQFLKDLLDRQLECYDRQHWQDD